MLHGIQVGPPLNTSCCDPTTAFTVDACMHSNANTAQLCRPHEKSHQQDTSMYKETNYQSLPHCATSACHGVQGSCLKLDMLYHLCCKINLDMTLRNRGRQTCSASAQSLVLSLHNDVWWWIHRDPWVLPVEAGARQAAIRSKQALAQGAGGASDHLALVKAFNGWSAARRAGQERGYCASNFLSSSTMMMVNGMRTQLLGELQVSKLLFGIITDLTSFCILSSLVFQSFQS